MKSKKTLLLPLVLLLVASLACSTEGSQAQPDLGGTQTSLELTRVAMGSPATPIAPTSGPVAADPQLSTPTGVPEVAQTTPESTELEEPVEPPSQPVGVRQGLSSLDSFRLKIVTVLNGPTQADKSRTVVEIESTEGGNRTHTVTNTTSSTAEDPEEEKDRTRQFQVDNMTCILDEDGGAPEVEYSSPLAKELQDIAAEMLDLNPLIANPVLVGQEDLNGVPTYHYTFVVPGLGATSGAEVIQNQGEYWLAVDGEYLVKYSLVLEIRDGPKDDPQSEAMLSKFNYELTDINQPIEINLPEGCQ